MSTILSVFGLQLWNLAVFLILTCSFSWWSFGWSNQFMLISSRHICIRYPIQNRRKHVAKERNTFGLWHIVERFGEENYVTCNRWLPSYLSSLFQSEAYCKAFHMEISFIHMQILVHLHINKTNFHMKGLAPGLALKQRQNASRKSPIELHIMWRTKIAALVSHVSTHFWPRIA